MSEAENSLGLRSEVEASADFFLKDFEGKSGRLLHFLARHGFEGSLDPSLDAEEVSQGPRNNHLGGLCMNLDDIKNLDDVTVLDAQELQEIEGGVPCDTWDIWCEDGTCMSCCILHRWFC